METADDPENRRRLAPNLDMHAWYDKGPDEG